MYKYTADISNICEMKMSCQIKNSKARLESSGFMILRAFFDLMTMVSTSETVIERFSTVLGQGDGKEVRRLNSRPYQRNWKNK